MKTLEIVVGTCTQIMWTSLLTKKKQISFLNSSLSINLGHVKLYFLSFWNFLANTVKWILNVCTCLAYERKFFGVFKLFGDCRLMYCFNHFAVLINVHMCSERSDEHNVMYAKNNKQENLWVLSNSKI